MYIESMSGRSSLSTLIQMKCWFIREAISRFSNDSLSITWPPVACGIPNTE